MPRIEDANSLPLATFWARFIPCSLDPTTHDATIQSTCPYTVICESSSSIKSHHFEACFNLIANSSANAYAASSIGWSPTKKRKEMRLPDLRYLLLTDSTAHVQGFLSFMLTYEDGHEVIYCYELHLSPLVQRRGLGRHLMGLIDGVGKRAGVEKSMLTVFVENQAALNFYEKLGYSKDEYSPEPRKMRHGTVKMPTYVILSKSLQGWTTDEQGSDDG
ncbi:MAG: hypothetical protein Q9182_003568 [Xanthomendoza sp. 2 TL-2023]